MTEPAVASTIDLTAPGKQIGRLQYPKITNTGGWAYSFVPVATIARGDGPTVLVSGGNHGDEYEGQVAALRLVQEIDPDGVNGRIVDTRTFEPYKEGNTVRLPVEVETLDPLRRIKDVTVEIWAGAPGKPRPGSTTIPGRTPGRYVRPIRTPRSTTELS